MGSTVPIFPTQLVGSWCKPKWLADHEKVYTPEGEWWRIPEEHRAEALNDSTLLAITDQDRAGLTFVTDGEQRRQTFSGHFYVLGNIDVENRGEIRNFGPGDIGTSITMKQRPAPEGATAGPGSDKPAERQRPRPTAPRVVGPVTWERSLLGNDLVFLKRYARGMTKMTIIGPSTLALRLVDEHYGSPAELAFGVADALNKEIRALEAIGVDLIQIDEPEVHFRYSQCKDYAVEAIDRALHGVQTRTSVHVCYGYSKNIAEKRANPVYEQALDIFRASTVKAVSLEYEQPGHGPDLLAHLEGKDVILGLLNLDTEAPVETVDHIIGRAREAMQVVPRERLSLAPDCGMWFLPRDRAFGKIRALELAAAALRNDARHGPQG